MANKTITAREKGLVIQQYKDGWPIRKIAAYASLTQYTVLKIVKESGTEMRNGCVFTKDAIDLVNRLYAEGSSLDEILKETGMKSKQTIYRLLTPDIKRRRNR